MADNVKQLGAGEIRRLLGLLDAELVRRGQRATVYVVGGANISLAVDSSRSTTDIDVVVKRGHDVVFEASAAVAEREVGLGDDWINTVFTGEGSEGGIAWQWFDRKGEDSPAVLMSGDGLVVELASPEMMLALKTLADRPHDVTDAHKLMRLTGIGLKDPLALGRNLARFTGRRIFDAQGAPGMFLNIDPRFPHIYDGAPDDIRPDGGYGVNPRPAREQARKDETLDRRERERVRQADKARQAMVQGAQLPSDGQRCGSVTVLSVNGRETRRSKPCRRRAGHGGGHWPRLWGGAR